MIGMLQNNPKNRNTNIESQTCVGHINLQHTKIEGLPYADDIILMANIAEKMQ